MPRLGFASSQWTWKKDIKPGGMHSTLLHTGRVLRKVPVSSKNMMCNKHISPTFPGVTWVELPEVMLSWMDVGTWHLLRAGGFLVNKCRGCQKKSTDLVKGVPCCAKLSRRPLRSERRPQPMASKPPSCAMELINILKMVFTTGIPSQRMS